MFSFVTFPAADLTKGGKGIYRGPVSGNRKADCTVTVSDDDFVGLATQRLNGQQVRSLMTGPSISHLNCNLRDCTLLLHYFDQKLNFCY